MNNLNEFATSDELAPSLAKNVAKRLGAAITQNGKASLAVSGGSTPLKFFKALSGQDIDWERVSITLIDERWTSPDTDRSNARLVQQNLLQGNASKANFLPLFVEGMSVEQSIPQTTQKLQESVLPLDVAILGMGGDGHTASFFPGGSKLDAATRTDTKDILSSMEAEGAGEERITLTLPQILGAGLLALHIEGETKMNVLKSALGEGEANELPIRHVLRNCSTIEIYWAP